MQEFRINAMFATQRMCECVTIASTPDRRGNPFPLKLIGERTISRFSDTSRALDLTQV